MRGLRLAGTDDSPNSEQSTMTKIPSSSHWHGGGHSCVAGPCLSWVRPYPHTPGADPQTPPATQRSRNTGSMSDCPPVSIYTCRDFCLLTLSFVLSDVSRGSFDQVRRFQCFFAFPNTPLLATGSVQKPLTAFSPVQVVHTVNLSLSQVLSPHLSYLSVTTSSPGVNFAVTSFPSSLSSLSLCPLLSHRLSPPNTATLSPSLSLSLYISLALSVPLSPYLL